MVCIYIHVCVPTEHHIHSEVFLYCVVTSYIRLVDNCHGNGPGVLSQLPHKYHLISVPNDARLVLKRKR